MAAFRFFSWFLVAAAIALLGADAISSIESGEPVIRSTAEVLGFAGINAGAIVGNAPGAMAGALKTLFDLPLWAIFGLIGVILVLIFRPMN